MNVILDHLISAQNPSCISWYAVAPNKTNYRVYESGEYHVKYFI